MNVLMYDGVIRMRSVSFAGRLEVYTMFDDPNEDLGFGSPIVQAWLADDDLQELTVTSTDFGISRTYRKFYGGTMLANEGESLVDAYCRHGIAYNASQPADKRYAVIPYAQGQPLLPSISGEDPIPKHSHVDSASRRDA